jgi:hypothetical protein
MKKVLSLVLAICLLAVPVQAADMIRQQVITATTLDDDPTSVSSTAIVNKGYERIGFLLVLDETDSGNDTSGTITVDYSYDNTTWVTGMGFYNSTAPLTVVTSIATNAGASTDQNVMIWLDGKVAAPYVRVTVTITGGAAGGDDQIVVTGYAMLYR